MKERSKVTLVLKGNIRGSLKWGILWGPWISGASLISTDPMDQNWGTDWLQFFSYCYSWMFFLERWGEIIQKLPISCTWAAAVTVLASFSFFPSADLQFVSKRTLSQNKLYSNSERNVTTSPGSGDSSWTRAVETRPEQKASPVCFPFTWLVSFFSSVYSEVAGAT